MPKYIDAYEFRRNLDKIYPFDKYTQDTSPCFDEAKSQLLIALDAEDEAIVRCKDCKYYYAHPDLYRTCHLHREIDGCSEMMSVDDFCSKGEKKDG